MGKISTFFILFLLVKTCALGQNVHTLRIRKPVADTNTTTASTTRILPVTQPILPVAQPILPDLTVLNVYPDSSIFLNNDNSELIRGNGTTFMLTLYPDKTCRYWEKDSVSFSPQELRNYRNGRDSMVICLHFGTDKYNPHEFFGWGKTRIDWFAFNGNQRATQQLIDIDQLYRNTEIKKKKKLPEGDKMRIYRVLFKNKKKQTIFSRSFTSNQFDVLIIPSFVETVTFINVKSQAPKDRVRQAEDEFRKNEIWATRTEQIKSKKKDIGKKVKTAKNPLRKVILELRYSYWDNKKVKKVTTLTDKQKRRRDRKYGIHKLSSFSVPASSLRNFNSNR